ITHDEERILKRLKSKLGLTNVEMHFIMGLVRNIDKDSNFTPSEFELALKNLQTQGIVCYISKKVENRQFVIPTDIRDVVASKYNYPMDFKSYSLLLNDISKNALRNLAKQRGLMVSGSKEEII